MNKIFRLNDMQIYEICELLLQRKKDLELKIQAYKEDQKQYDLRWHNELSIIIELLNKFGYTFIG